MPGLNAGRLTVVADLVASSAAMFGQDAGTGTLLIVLGLLVLAVVFFRAKARARKGPNETPTRTFRRATTFGTEATLTSLERLVADLQEYSRDALAKLDTKARILSKLIIDADQRIGRLQQLTGSANQPSQPSQASQLPQPPGSASFAPVPTAAAKDELLVNLQGRQAEKGIQSAESAGGAEKADERAGQTSPTCGPAAAGPTDPRHERIRAMRAAGLGSAQIAADLSVSRGEVELVLAMQPRQEERT